MTATTDHSCSETEVQPQQKPQHAYAGSDHSCSEIEVQPQRGWGARVCGVHHSCSEPRSSRNVVSMALLGVMIIAVQKPRSSRN
ncbi:MAG: hypothetical protein JWS10_1084 [Cypionkella sp.]|nr:hypothetical protein [Cypionkella sp.]